MYLNRVHPAIRKRLSMAIEAVQSGEVDVSDVTNELHLARMTGEDAAELYSLVTEIEEKAKEVAPEQYNVFQQQKGLETRLHVGEKMLSHLKTVTALAEQHARIKQVKQDIKDISSLQELFRKVGEIAVKTIPDKGILKAFLVELRTMSIDDGTQGTTITPDRDVLEMDEATLGVSVFTDNNVTPQMENEENAIDS